MLYVTRLRLTEEVICYTMSQQARELLLWDTGLLRKLLVGGSSLQWDKVLDVVSEDGLQADRSGKLFTSTHCLPPINLLVTYRLSDYGLDWPLIEPP
jgi:hypothetical protein